MSNNPATIAYLAGLRDAQRMELEATLQAASAPLAQAAVTLATQSIRQGDIAPADIRAFADALQREITRIADAAYRYGALNATHGAFTTFDVYKPQISTPAHTGAGRE